MKKKACNQIGQWQWMARAIWLGACSMLLTGCMGHSGRTIHAHVVALEQRIDYNRFGSMNPYGMIYALKRDVIDRSTRRLMDEHSRPGDVELRNGKRPRPLVLRVSPGDRLVVHFTNMLSPEQPDLSSRRWEAPYMNLNEKELPGEEQEPLGPPVTGHAATNGCGADLATKTPPNPADRRNDWPRTRCAAMTISGLRPSGETFDARVTGLQGIPPGDSMDYQWNISTVSRGSTHLFFSNAAPAGGQGDGGSLVHGLFGAVHIEPQGSRWYRSQVSGEDLAMARAQRRGETFLNYEAENNDGIPILNLLKQLNANEFELIHGDLNAVIVDHKPNEEPAFREFTAIFHDELKTFYRDEFTALETAFTFAGIRDGFAINYGASGMGTILLANRIGMGPAKDCVECAYEEFFLESWANGDPALLPQYVDDPANVHHSYLNDRVEIRNLHAGPKETHVFHLHAHQWLAQQESGTGTYLDSQTIAPQQGFTYPIYYGGSGNRNRTPGDSIFHCHLYPHFAQGMWALWRVHDVFEDGTRRLPDGELGPGTEPKTGATEPHTGTPIPAVVPLPKQAMPPTPGYGKDENPGFPFFIPGEAGHRSPQPPLDMVEDGGLPRHVITKGTREVSHLSPEQVAALPAEQLIRRALATGDMSVVLKEAHMKVLPSGGTAQEQAAMTFHGRPAGHASTTPEGDSATFDVNGRAAQPGAPFADPCDPKVARLIDAVGEDGQVRTREYHVSAVQADLTVNKAGWHDPQGRINVLDRDVATFEEKKTDQASPFFFRAHSGECVLFYHTNRTPHELRLDDFQVRTPTDTIGQHIHLVKFDVTASDGSGNGWNYEDGTFSRGAILERIEATQAPDGEVVDETGKTVRLEPKTGPHGDPIFQTTIQRWFADPLVADHYACEAGGGIRGNPSHAHHACQDRTIRTVFTHDHFGPSSIQQHGFYSALLVEPAGSEWLKPNGDPMPDGVGTQAMILKADDPVLHRDHREFALAVADFALLYDPHRQPEGEPHGMANLLIKADRELGSHDPEAVTKLREHAEKYWEDHGHPVAPPFLPEAISKDHHDPYLVNYKHEPIPLRIGKSDSSSIKRQKTQADAKPGDVRNPGDMAWAFDSTVHGDPFTEIFEGYEGELAQLRVVQGAQEVQHMLNIHGMRWPREIANPDSPLVAAQEIGISEHFEMRLGFANVFRGNPFADYLYNFGPVDDLWNGAWGLLRAYNGMDAVDPGRVRIGDRLKPLPSNPTGKVHLSNKAKSQTYDGTCPTPERFEEGKASEVTFYVDAVSLRDWLGHDLPFDRKSGIYDPNPLAFILLKRVAVGEAMPDLADIDRIREELKQHYTSRLSDPDIKDPVEPLVLRANAGDCIRVELANRLPVQLDDKLGDALMPKIVPLNVDRCDHADSECNKTDRRDADDVKPSSWVSLHPQLLTHNVVIHNGAAVGHNHEQPLGPGERTRVYWYAGIAHLDGDQLKHEPKELGPINLVSWGDIINHGPHGLVGALIIEPKDATYYDPVTGRQVPNGGISARIEYPDPETRDRTSFREHIVLYRDGLNLWYPKNEGQPAPIPDCRICDDSYDLGEKGLNYHSAPFWARLDQEPNTNLNAAFFPSDFFLPSYKEIPTTTYPAYPDEEVRFRVLQPHGRNRQRAFLLYGHDFEDMLPYFGSAHSPLISVGKAITVKIPTHTLVTGSTEMVRRICGPVARGEPLTWKTQKRL